MAWQGCKLRQAYSGTRGRLLERIKPVILCGSVASIAVNSPAVILRPGLGPDSRIALPVAVAVALGLNDKSQTSAEPIIVSINYHITSQLSIAMFVTYLGWTRKFLPPGVTPMTPPRGKRVCVIAPARPPKSGNL